MTDPKIIDLNDEGSASEGEPDIQLEDCERTRCEVWTRVMGYHRPVFAFNAGKRSEHQERQYFAETSTIT